MGSSNQFKSWLDNWVKAKSRNKAEVWIENWVKEEGKKYSHSEE